MKRCLTLLVFLLITFMSCKTDQDKKSERARVTSEKKISETKSSFEDLDGYPVELADFKGKRVLLNYWATWCRPCIEEMPALLLAQEALKDDNYVFLLASDQSIEKIKEFKAKKKFDFNFLKFNGSLTDMKINALPATFIYSESGKFRNRIDGATAWDSPKILDKLRAIK